MPDPRRLPVKWESSHSGENDKPGQNGETGGQDQRKVTSFPGANREHLPPTGHGRAPTPSEMAARHDAQQDRQRENDDDGWDLIDAGTFTQEEAWEQAEVTDNGGYEGTRVTDTRPGPADAAEIRDSVRAEFQGVFDAQGQLIETYKERSDSFKAEITTLRERNDVLEDRLVASSLTIDDLRSENSQLRAELTSAKRDRPAEGQPAAEQPRPVEVKKEGGDQGEVTEDAKKIEQLENEVAEGAAERRDLVKTIARQGTSIERLETDVDQLRNENAELRTENNSLKDRIAELRTKLADVLKKGGKDQLSEGNDQAPPEDDESSAAVRRQDDGSGQEEATGESRQKRALHLPSEKATAAMTGFLGAADAIASLTHLLTTGETGAIGASATAIVGAYLWFKSGHDERRKREKNADQHEN